MLGRADPGSKGSLPFPRAAFHLAVSAGRSRGPAHPRGHGGRFLTLRAYVDPATHRVEVSQGLLERSAMRAVLETVYGNFRLIDGLRFAFHEESYASGTRRGTDGYFHGSPSDNHQLCDETANRKFSVARGCTKALH